MLPEMSSAAAEGWDAAVPPNETVDDDGNPFPDDPGFAVPDPRAPGRRAFDDPEVRELREHLRAANGLRGLEICAPDEIERAARIFRRDGFVVVRDLLGAAELGRLRAGCARALAQILEAPGSGGRRYPTESWRLPHRYSFGTCSASRQMLHDVDWACAVDLPTTTPILTRIFGSADYLVWGGGGDLCLPGAIEYQHLHADLWDRQELPEGRIRQAEELGVDLKGRDPTSELDVRTQRRILERTPPIVTINFLMSDLTFENGPIRQIPGSHALQQRPPAPEDEPEWMRLSTLVGAPAGAGVFRDGRAWHGGTPNLSRDVRAMPNIEYMAPWMPEASTTRTMPHEIWETLSPHGRRLCRSVKAEPGAWPPGAGRLYPLANERRAFRRSQHESASDDAGADPGTAPAGRAPGV